jgi:hypothetical protein
MAFEQYGILDGKLKEALIAHRRDPVGYFAEKTEIIAERIRVLETKLMSKTLAFQEIVDMQEELNNLREGKLDEPFESHKNELQNTVSFHKHSRKTSPGGETPASVEVAPETAVSEKPDTVCTFEDLHLKVEDRLQLEPPSIISHERFTINLIGYLKGACILVTPPIGANGLRLPLQEKDKVVIRSFSGENAFAFATTIERVITQPYVYLHLSFPDIIQGIKVRNAPRIKTNIITTVQNSQSGTIVHNSALISDVSADGVSLVSKRALGNKGDVIDLAFRVHLHNVEAMLSIKGVIRALVSEEDIPDEKKTGNIHHGIEFQNLQPNDHVILQSMIYQQMIENPHGMM